MARLKEKYNAEIAPALMKQFGYKSVMQIPKIDKVVVNVGYLGQTTCTLQEAMAASRFMMPPSSP